MTDEQKNNLKLDMTKDLYPGERIIIIIFTTYSFIVLQISLGLDKDPSLLSDTMTPNTSPQKAAGTTVLINGGYDPCQYVGRDTLLL